MAPDRRLSGHGSSPGSLRAERVHGLGSPAAAGSAGAHSPPSPLRRAGASPAAARMEQLKYRYSERLSAACDDLSRLVVEQQHLRTEQARRSALSPGATSRRSEYYPPAEEGSPLSGAQGFRRAAARARAHSPVCPRKVPSAKDDVTLHRGTIHGVPVTLPEPSPALLAALAPPPLGRPGWAGIEEWSEYRYRHQCRLTAEVLQDSRDEAVHDLTDAVDGDLERRGETLMHTMQRLHACSPLIAPGRLGAELRRAADDPTFGLTPVTRFYNVSYLIKQPRARSGSPARTLDDVAEAVRGMDTTRRTAIDRVRPASAGCSAGAVARRPSRLGATPFVVSQPAPAQKRVHPIQYGSKRWHDLVQGAGTLRLPGETERTRSDRREVWRAYSASP